MERNRNIKKSRNLALKMLSSNFENHLDFSTESCEIDDTKLFRKSILMPQITFRNLRKTLFPVNEDILTLVKIP